jgi:hypothetical protein
VLRALHACGSDQHCPSHGVFIPSAVASTKEPVARAVPPADTLRLQGSSPLDALLPFEPPRHFCRGRSWDFHLQGLVPPGDPALFRADRALLSVARPRSPHASSVKSGPGLLSELIRLREGPSKPSSGLYSLRESVPLHVRFRVVHRPMPSWFSSSPGLSPPWSAGWPSPSVRSRASHRPAPFRATIDPAPQRFARPGGGVVSHETASPPEVLPLYPPVSSRVPAALGY